MPCASEPVVVTAYDPEWATRFAALQERLESALGEMARRIEHVGSTSVPGLAGKPVIDLDVVVRSAADIPAAITAVEQLGYRHEGNKGIPGREAFRWPAGEQRHHLYICVEECQAFQDHLLFRDYLRAHPETAKAYATLKHNAVALHSADRAAYARAKAAFIEKITRQAEAAYRAPQPRRS